MKPVGYTFLNKYYRLLLPKLGMEVFQDPSADKEKHISYGADIRKVLPGTRSISDSPYDHMVLAIKYQGIRLHFFAAIFKSVDVEELTAFIAEKPISAYNRVIWFLYEWLTGNKLDLPDLKTGNYVRLFDDDYYFTLENGDRDKRTRIVNNAIGTNEFCPTIRKTPEIKELEKVDVYETAYAEMQSIGEDLNADVIGRSVNYLYTKETKSSTEIEKETPSSKRMKKFLNAIKNAGLFELDKEKLIDIQNQIIEETKRTDDFRKEEIYVGTTIHRFGEIDEDMHYIAPLAKHVPSLVDGLINTHDRLMIDGKVPALMHATVISFGLVYIHPLVDGNGRTHRYLIHDIMKQREPNHEFIIPISAAILKNPNDYDKVLETISRPVMALLDWELDSGNGNRVRINNDIDFMYRFPDYTEHVIFVYKMMNTAIASELLEEVCLLYVFDMLKKCINSMADIPNAQLDKVVSILLNGGGVVSKKKRSFVLNEVQEDILQAVENYAEPLISDIKTRLNVDLKEIMNRQH